MRDEMDASAYGLPLGTGWIVRFRSPDVDFDEALAAGQDRMMEYFSDAIGGLRTGHVDELRALGFFSSVETAVGFSVNVGSWMEVPASQLGSIIQIVDVIMPNATVGVRNLLLDLRRMMEAAEQDGCPVGFMLSD